MMKFLKRILSVLLVLALLCCSAFAEAPKADALLEGQLSMQDIETINGGHAKPFTQNGCVTFVAGPCADGPVKTEGDARRVAASMIRLMGGNEKTHLEPWRVLRDSVGNVYYVYQQTYADLIVQGGAVKVITDPAGNMLGLTGSLVTELPQETDSAITAQEAEALVIQHETGLHRPEPQIMTELTGRIVLPVQRELDMDSEEESELSRFVWAVYTTNPMASVSSGTDLPYLAHYVTLNGEYLYNLPTILPGDAVAKAGYDANYVFQFMESVPYTGYVDMADGSQREITVDVMRDTRTGMYYLGNIEHKIVVADCWEFLYNHGNVQLEYSTDNLSWDQVGLKSLYNYCRAYDYYKALGWEGGDGQGTPIIILKDFCDKDHHPMDNAAYVGKYYGWQAFLSSSVNRFSECLDVIAHEFTHCVTHSVMTYNGYMNDYGAINESMSDIQGNLCEMMFGATTDETWLIGENAMKVRSMSAPHLYQQPDYSWDIYYQPKVKNPTDVNDRGGVHTNSSLLNHLAYRLCALGGMTLEEARAFWFAMDCAMVPGTDYPQLKELLPWVMHYMGMDAYQSALAEALTATRLGDDALPETLEENQALLTLNLPDTEIFNNGSWMLSLVSLNVEKLEEKLKTVTEKVRNQDLEDFPLLLRSLIGLFQNASVSEEEHKMRAEALGAFVESITEIMEKDQWSSDSQAWINQLKLNPDVKETVDWLRANVEEVFYSASGSAGPDGHTITMMSRPGRTIPCLLYMTVEPNSTVLKQFNVVFYVNHQWMDITSVLSLNQDPKEANTEIMDRVMDDLTSKIADLIFERASLNDYLDLLTLDVKGGETTEIPNTGLEQVDLSANMASGIALDDTLEVINTKSRPKLPEDAPAPEPVL